jgi:hypothetical protein
MAEQYIFISHSSTDKVYADKLYTRMLSDGYWVWMDTSLEPAKEWEKQIEDNLRKAEVLIVLFSSDSISRDWVRHEGSMAYALKHFIIPVNIEEPRTYVSTQLPIWTRKRQLHNLIDGSSNYEEKYQELKDLLEKPLSIRQYLIQMLSPYQESGMLLDEVALALIDAHFNDLHLERWSRDRRELALQLIEESRFKLEKYWTRYDKLNDAYKKSRTDGLELKQVVRALYLAMKLREFLVIIAIIALLAIVGLGIYFEYESWIRSLF